MKRSEQVPARCSWVLRPAAACLDCPGHVYFAGAGLGALLAVAFLLAFGALA